MKDLYFLSHICEVKYDVPSWSTFGSGGSLACVVYPKTADETVRAVNTLSREGIPFVTLGACSNTLISDSGVKGVVISTTALKGKTLVDGGMYLLAGEKINGVCRFACENCMSGIEGLCSIPGSIGGGLAMNCGAFGREIGDVVEYADVLIEGKVERIEAADMDFAYRRSNIKELGTVVGTKLQLSSGNKYQIAKDMKGYTLARGKSQPKGKSLGSVFKKAGDVSAGYYIDRAGLKGYAIGGAEISNIHANFILNTGGATSSDFLRLAEYARQEVDKQYGIKLKYEVDYI